MKPIERFGILCLYGFSTFGSGLAVMDTDPVSPWIVGFLGMCSGFMLFGLSVEEPKASE